MKRELNALKQAVAENGQEIGGLKKAVAENGQEIEGLKKAVAENSQEIAGLKKAVAGNSRDIESLNGQVRRLAIEVVNVKGEVGDLRNSMNLGFRRLLDTMNKRFDDFIPFVEAARRDRITASDAYMAIVRRLERLERKAA